MLRQVPVGWPHNPAGLYAMLIESAVGWYEYSGDARVLQVATDSRRIHSYDLVKDAHVLVTFTATNHNVWELQTGVSFDVHNTGTTLDRVKICEDRRTKD